ncbi:DUF3168 domain-containing protein [Blastomonas sp. AAP53]|uniref:DUF3168 domain-containing protein n=1 Tax=Blastomonas sp. AAP53 TaxID=1248760 RepID=UPI000319962C|nr:DUF3168 domain-containing protein [Blastomonas sp. AAP53]
MSLEQDFALAVIDWLAGDAALMAQVNGVFHRSPARIVAPYVLLDDVLATDWSTKDRPGREARLAFTIRDGSDDAVPVSAIAAALEARVLATPRTGTGYRLVSLSPLRSRTLRNGDLWIVTLDYRARLLSL